jgi:starch-binding outer membrane protein, SusD/RagB family
MKRIAIASLIGLLSVIVIIACTDLSETVYSDVLASEFYQTEEEIIASMAPAYGELRNYANANLYRVRSMGTDEVVTPTRGRHWYDGGAFQRFHEHSWSTDHSWLRNSWDILFGWVNRSNMLQYQYEQMTGMNPDLRDQFTAELKMIRAFSYYQLIDFFGNVPIVDRFDVPEDFNAANHSNFETGRTEVFNFIEQDIISNIDNLNDNVDPSTYGRFHKYAAHAMLVRLYMNAETWTGTPRWDDAIAHADAIINSGHFELEPDYFYNFTVNNRNSRENIFVVPFEDGRTGGNMSNMAYINHHHYQMGRYFNAPRGGNNGISALPSHYRSFDEADRRRNGWLTGPLYDSSTGAALVCTEESAPHPLNYTVDYVNIHDPSDNAMYDYRNALEYHGARMVKWEINYNSDAGNDLAVVRYADILLLKAEALMRKNGGQATQEAVDLVNQVRERAFENPSEHEYTTATLTMDELLAERSRELYFEGVRRNDLVRFDRWVRGEWEWADRSNEGDYRNVFPIPQHHINVNPNLTQNPGY